MYRALGVNWTYGVAIAAAIGIFLATPNTMAAAPPDQASHTNCIAIVSPTVEGMPGNFADASNAVRDLMASYLQGPSEKVLVLEAKLPSLAAEEAKQKACEPLLIINVHRKSGGSHSFMKALGQGAGASSWTLPYGGSAASSAARTGTVAGLQTVSSLAQSTKARDEISLDYRLQSADGQVQFGPKTEKRTAKTDGEDLLAPVVEHAAETIVTRTISK